MAQTSRGTLQLKGRWLWFSAQPIIFLCSLTLHCSAFCYRVAKVSRMISLHRLDGRVYRLKIYRRASFSQRARCGAETDEAEMPADWAGFGALQKRLGPKNGARRRPLGAPEPRRPECEVATLNALFTSVLSVDEWRLQVPALLRRSITSKTSYNFSPVLSPKYARHREFSILQQVTCE
jgi:hypothetical protein